MSVVKCNTENVAKTNEQLINELAELRQRFSELQASAPVSKQMQELFETLSNNAPTGIYIAQDGKFQYVNPWFEEIADRGKDELLGTDPLSYVHPEDREVTRENAIQILKGEEHRPFEYRLIGKSGEVRWRSERIASIQYRGRRAILGNVVEITERKRAEEGLKQAMADLAQSNAELEQFAYVASHDLQEPLRMVASYTQLLARRYKGKLDADADEFIAYAVDGANRMQNLINDLLDYSRVSTRGRPLKMIDCEAVLNETLINLQKAIEESNAIITHDPLPAVMADATQMVQLFQNLLSNSIKFRREEPPRIRISAQQNKNGWLFSVCDNGIGMDMQYANRVFVIFQRLHSRFEYGGTGMGLAICKKIIERHNGQIWVESEPGNGSTFYFTIPSKGDK